MKHFIKSYATLLILFLTNTLFSQVPSIASFAPLSGPVGTTVVLTGTNFSSTAANNIVYFGAARANVTASTTTSCTVTVPNGATYSKISLEVGIVTGYSKKPFIVSSACPAPVTTTSFDSASFNAGSGTNPLYSVLGDFDGDGKNDAAVNFNGTQQLQFMRNTSTIGSVSFTPDATKGTGADGRGLAIGDLNGDGLLDVVINNSQFTNAGVFRNTSTLGAISFANSVTFDLCTTNNTGDGGICLGDLDGDGKPEIIAANGTVDSISVLRNLNSTAGSTFTSGSFTSHFRFFVTSKPQFVYVDDIDGDGKLDIVTANTTSNNVAVLRNTCSVGVISFAPPVYFATGASPRDFSIGDIDLDGKPDLVVPNNTGSSISILQNLSTSGNISFATKVDFTTGTNPRDADISDINGDGLPDIITVNAGSDEIEVFQNTSTPGVINASTLSGSKSFPLPIGSDPRQLSIGDLDGDGHPDLVTLSQVTDRVSTGRNLIWGGPIMTSASSKSICSGTSVGLTLTATPSSGTSYSWIAASNANVTGESTTAQTGNVINNTLTNTTTTPQAVVYTVTPTSSTTCSGGTPQPQIVTITVNPKPAMTSSTSGSICNGGTLSHTLTSGASATYSWLTTDNPNTTGESTTAQTGNVINNTITNTLSTAQTLVYTVTPTGTAGGCVGGTQLVTITVNPTPAMTSANSSTVCSGVALNLPLTSNISSTYSWLAANNANTTGESTTATSGATINNTIVNSSTSTQLVIYTVTPTSTAGCSGTAQTVTATVNAAPSMTSANTTTVCSGIALNFPFTSNVTATYSWLATDNPNTSGESTSAQSTTTLNNTIVSNSTVSTAQSVIYTVTPTSTAGSCLGAAQTITVTVNQKPVMSNPTFGTVCSGVPLAFALTTIGAPSTFSWLAANNANTTGESLTTQTLSTINNTIVSTATVATGVIYTVTPTSTGGGCVGAAQTITITVNPIPAVNVNSASICNGQTATLSASGATTYSWNTSATTNTISVTPSTTTFYTVTGTTSGCSSTKTATVTVYALPVMTSASTTTVCSGVALNFPLTSNIAATYSWVSNNNPNTTGESTTTQTGSTINNTITNLLNAATTCIYTVTPTSTVGCTGAPQSVTVTINPSPVMTSTTSTSICSGAALSVALSANVASNFTWLTTANANTSGESTTTQTTSTINNTITSTTTTPTTLIYTVTPTSTGGSCLGTVQTVTVTVNPKPTMTSGTSAIVCSGTALGVSLTSDAAATYNWLTTDNANTTGESTTSQSGSTINNTITSTTTTATLLVYTVTPTGTAGSCVGAAQTVTVTVNPKPVMTSASSTSICSETGMNFSLTSNAPATYSWVSSNNASTTGESTTTQIGSVINNTITSSLNAATTCVYTVTPSGTTGSCIGTAQTVTVTVNPKPVMNSASSKTICSGSSVGLALTTTGAASTFQWLATSNANVSGESTSAQSTSTINNTLTATSSNTTAVVYTVTPTGTAGSCAGNAQVVTVNLDYAPTANAGKDSSMCTGNIVLYANNPSPATGVWAFNSKTDVFTNVSILTPTAYNSGASFTGTFNTNDKVTLKWTITSPLGTCPVTIDSSTFTKISCPLSANFTASGNDFCLKPGDSASVTFTDNSSQGGFAITSYTWTFTGGNPSSYIGKTPPVVKYPYSAGVTTYPVTLQITDASSATSTSPTQNITIRPKPSAPGVISGTTTVCQGQTNVSYSVTPVTNATSYAWVFPSGNVFSTNNIETTNFSSVAVSGTIKVAGMNVSCGAGDTSYLSVTVNPLPGVAGVITGSTTVCQGVSGVSYSLAPVANATSYSWSFPSGISSGGTTNSISANFNTSAQSGLITVHGVNACGAGTDNTFSVTVNPLPVAAGTITGSSSVCQLATGVTYSIVPVTNATSYNWSFPTGATSTSTTNIASVDFSSSAATGIISVNGVNACGSGGAATFNVTVNPIPSAAGSITGSVTVCQGQSGVNYSVPSINNATGYNWTFPSGASSVNPNNIAVTDFNTSAVSGLITVEGSNICGVGPGSTFSVTVNPLPGTAGVITGSTTVCQGVTGVSYSLAGIANATSYNWTFPSGVSSAGTTNSISADFSTSAQSGLITVNGVNACGAGTGNTFSVTVDPLPSAAGPVSGSVTVCQNQTGVSYSIPTIANATSYNWSFLGAIGSNTVTANSAVLNFNSSSTSATIFVSGNNSCGNGSTAVLNITVNSIPTAAGSISGSVTVCQGQNGVSYSIPSISNATSYNWTFPIGASSTNPNNIASTDFDVTAQSGLIVVSGVNSCGTGPSSSYSVTVNPLPDAASLITGAASVCQGQNGASYFVNPIANATSYIWTSPSGSNGTATLNNYSVDYSVTASSGNITVYGQNACGQGSSSTLAVTVNPLPSAPAFSGTAIITLCPLPDSMLFVVPAALNATSYNWQLASGTYLSGSISTDDSIYVGFTSVGSADSIKVASVNGCGMSAYSFMLLNLQSIPTPAICMATVDTTSTYNEIYWDKSAYNHSYTFHIYRDTANNNYGLIGTVPFDSLSMFKDIDRSLYAANGDPNVSSWRYKIAVEDSCGNMSAMSPYHQTMFMQDNSGNFSWNQYQIEGQVIPVPQLSSYLFERDNLSTWAWSTIQVLSASSTAYTDPNYSTYQPTANWRSETQWSIVCTPTLKLNTNSTQGTIVRSKSNISNNKTTAIQHVENSFAVYPNPASNEITIQLSKDCKNCTAELYNSLGQILVSEKLLSMENKINLSEFENGVYYLKIKGDMGTRSIQKIVVQH